MLTHKRAKELKWMRRIKRMDKRELDREFKKIGKTSMPMNVVLFLMERVKLSN